MSSTPVAMSAIGEGVMLTTACRRDGSTDSSTASVSELRPLCETPNTGCRLAGNGSGWSPAPSRQECTPRLRSDHTGAQAAARLAPIPTNTGPGPVSSPAVASEATDGASRAIAASSSSAWVARAVA